MPGVHSYNLPDVEDQWISRTATPEEEAFEKLPLAGKLNAIKLAMASEDEKVAGAQFQQDEATFRAMYPAYKDSPRNAQMLKTYWEDVFGVSIPTLAQLEEAYITLRQRNVLDLNQAAVAAENAAALKERVEAIRAERTKLEFNEADAYSMPLEELRAREAQLHARARGEK